MTQVLYTGNIMFLIGCSSPPLSGLALYQVDVKHLAENLELAAREDGAKSGGENFTVILPPELPTYWRVGIHGKGLELPALSQPHTQSPTPSHDSSHTCS
jgi:hypothetical protein